LGSGECTPAARLLYGRCQLGVIQRLYFDVIRAGYLGLLFLASAFGFHDRSHFNFADARRNSG
jgi:hypothetical protein